VLAASVALTLVTAACNGSTPTATSTPTPTPSATPTVDPLAAATALGELASAGAAASYSASYRAEGSSAGTALIFRTPHAYRFELTTHQGGKLRKAVLIRTPGGTISCTVLPRPVTCLLVALRNNPIPALFDAGLQHVFSDYLVALSHPSSTYDIVSVPVQSPKDGACFKVTVVATPAPSSAVAPGTYCLAADGLVTRVVYPSGQLVLATHGPGPAYSKFTPPVRATRLPGL
jgi:hypothetical protein